MIRPASNADLSAIRALLTEAALPTEDLKRSAIEFWLIGQAPRVEALVGLEVHGAVGLLRSLVVTPEQRGRGLGNQLVEHLEAEARQRGLEALYLLTLSADRYFAQRGYQMIPRQAAPDAVQHSHEFHSLCPASAVCMVKRP